VKKRTVFIILSMLLTFSLLQNMVARAFGHSLFDQILKAYVDEKGLWITTESQKTVFFSSIWNP
jgi:hypothetical protein